MTKPIISQNILKEFLHYDPDTGIFTWKARDRKWFKTEGAFKIWNGRFPGEVAGHRNKLGYICIGIFGISFYAHRLAFLYMTGAFPPKHTDHIKGIPSDNRWGKIRSVTNTENQKNAAIRKDNTSGVTGVCWDTAAQKWRSQIKIDGEVGFLGNFEEFEDAVIAREKAEIKYNYHPNHGRRTGE